MRSSSAIVRLVVCIRLVKKRQDFTYRQVSDIYGDYASTPATKIVSCPLEFLNKTGIYQPILPSHSWYQLQKRVSVCTKMPSFLEGDFR